MRKSMPGSGTPVCHNEDYSIFSLCIASAFFKKKSVFPCSLHKSVSLVPSPPTPSALGQFALNSQDVLLWVTGVDVSTMHDDQQAEIRNKMLGFIFQQYNLLPKLNLAENVEVPLMYAGVGKAERRRRSLEALERVGLREKWRHKPSQLSGGQQQRVSIARALAGSPSVILADEPTGALDSRTGREVLGFLKKLNREGDTVVLITHDNSIAVKADRIVRLQDGKIIYDGDAHDPRAVVRPEEMEQDEPAAGGFSDASPAEQEAGA